MLRFASLLLMVCFGLDADAACIDQPENPTTRPKCSGGEGLLDVCQRSGHSMICDMNRNGSSDGAWAVAIKDDTATQVFCGSDYCLDGSSRDIYGYYYEELFGDDGNDVILGRGGLHDTVFAGGGDDQVTTGPGNDTVFLGGGNDECWTDAGNDTVAGGTGHDEVCTGEGDDTVDAGSGNDWVNAGSDVYGDYVDGGMGYDTCEGDESGPGCDVFGTLSCP